MKCSVQFLLIHNSLKMCFLELLDCYWRFWIICGTWRWCQQVTDCTGRTDPDRSSPPQPRWATLKHWILCDRRRAADVPVHLVTDCLTLQQKSKWKNSRCWRDGKHFDNEGLQTAGTFSFLCVCNSQDVLFYVGSEPNSGSVGVSSPISVILLQFFVLLFSLQKETLD